MKNSVIIDKIQTPVAVIDRNMCVVDANCAYSHRLNKNGEKVIGKKCFRSAYHSDHICSNSISTACPIEKTFRTKQKSLQVHHYWLEGKAIVEEVTSTPIFEKDGAVKYVIEEFRDISELLGLNKGIISVCSYCKKIKDKDGKWYTFEDYFHNHTGANFSHGVCNKCKSSFIREHQKSV